MLIVYSLFINHSIRKFVLIRYSLILISGMLIAMIKIYQRVISPLVAPGCRYNPTCSQYGMDAINKYGPIKGGYLTAKRFISCHPWGGSGYDPVP